MDNLPQHIAELIRDLPDLPIAQQRERHVLLIKALIEMGTVKQILRLREETKVCPLCEWLGEEHRMALVDLIDGHLALREMKLARRQVPAA